MDASPEISNFIELSAGSTAVLYPACSAGHKGTGDRLSQHQIQPRRKIATGAEGIAATAAVAVSTPIAGMGSSAARMAIFIH